VSPKDTGLYAFTDKSNANGSFGQVGIKLLTRKNRTGKRLTLEKTRFPRRTWQSRFQFNDYLY
jgi:hypothetical protein